MVVVVMVEICVGGGERLFSRCTIVIKESDRKKKGKQLSRQNIVNDSLLINAPMAASPLHYGSN